MGSVGCRDDSGFPCSALQPLGLVGSVGVFGGVGVFSSSPEEPHSGMGSAASSAHRSIHLEVDGRAQKVRGSGLDRGCTVTLLI